MSLERTCEGDVETRELWTLRVGLPVLMVVGLIVSSLGWHTDIYSMFVLGLALTSLTIRLMYLGEWFAFARLTVRDDAMVVISSPGLLRRDFIVSSEELSIVRTERIDRADLHHEASVCLLARRNYVKLTFKVPRTIPGCRWTNYMWAMRLQGDYRSMPPPMPGIKISGIVVATTDLTLGATQASG